LAYEESSRIPLVIRWPPLVKPGTVVDQLVLNIDVAPTLLEIGGATADWPIHGRSLVGLLAGRQTPWRTDFLIEHFSDKVFPRMRNMGYRAVRTERYKYIHYTELSGMDELYDLRADPYEIRNAVGDPAYGASLAQMRASLARLLEESK